MSNMIRPGDSGPCPVDNAPRSTCTSATYTATDLHVVDIPERTQPHTGPLQLYTVTVYGLQTMLWLNDFDAAALGVLPS